jgi:hypothetical protein
LIRQICPSCFQSVELPEAAAGTTAPCPACGKAFAVPAGYAPAVDADRPPPPPGLVPPGLTPPAAPPPAVESGEYARSATAVLSPKVVAWVPAVSLTGVLVLTFFAWCGTFPAGYRLFTQTPWQAVFGWVSLHDKFPQPIKERPALEAEVASNWVFLVPYLGLLAAATAVAWADRANVTPNPATAPRALAWVPGAWPHRHALLTGLAAVGLVLGVVQAARGFGLQTAVEARIAAAVAKAEAAPDAPALPYLEGEQIGHFGLGGTTARDVALTLHGLAVVALFARLWLDGRGAKPLPRLTAQW